MNRYVVVSVTGFARYYWTGHCWNVLRKLAREYTLSEAYCVAKQQRGEVVDAR